MQHQFSAVLGTNVESRFIEFTPGGTSWIASGSGAQLQKQPMDWADIRPSIVITGLVDCFPVNRPTLQTTTYPAEQVPPGGIPSVELGWAHADVRNAGVFRISNINISFDLPERFRVVNFGVSARNPADYTTDLICRDVLVVSGGVSAGMPHHSETIEISAVSRLKFPEGFSGASINNALAVNNNRIVVYPFTIMDDASVVKLWSDFTETI